MKGVIAFGRALLEAHDLDPIYEMLHEAKQRTLLNRDELYRWCLAYWCFYHAGVASIIADADDSIGDGQRPGYYAAMRRADAEKWPRGSERRHFRGKTSATAVEFFAAEYPNPRNAVDWLLRPGTTNPLRWDEIGERANEWPGFGPWIGFKIIDMADRVLDTPVDYEGCDVTAMYEMPAEGARIVAQEEGIRVEHVVPWVASHFDGIMAPPDRARPIGVTEVETMLCKYKSHLNGHYPVGKDTHEIGQALTGWGGLARKLRACLPSTTKS